MCGQNYVRCVNWKRVDIATTRRMMVVRVKDDSCYDR